MDSLALKNSLTERIDGDVYFDKATRHLYATDASDFRKVPAGVVAPKSAADVSALVTICGEHGASIIPRGGGSSVSGQTVGPGIVIDHTKYMSRILELNVEEKWVVVESGINLDKLNAELLPHGLMVGPDPSSSAVATIGGMVGNNSTGSHSVKYRQIADHVIEMEAVLADGSIATFGPKTVEEVESLSSLPGIEGELYRVIPDLLAEYDQDITDGFPKHWRNVAGFPLNRLRDELIADGVINLARFIPGSEGTLATITKVKLGLVIKPRFSYLALLPFENLSSALNLVPKILTFPVSAVELMTYPTLKLAYDHPIFSSRLKRFVTDLPGAMLIVEFAGVDFDELRQLAKSLRERLGKENYSGDIRMVETPQEIDLVWSIRKAVKGLQDSQAGATKRINVIDDPTVPVEELDSFTRQVTEVGQRYNVDLNFDAHASVGCLHLSPAINLRSADGIKTMEAMAREIMTIAIAHHGTSTGEHGEGLARSYFNKQVYGDRLHQAFVKVKNLFDPENRFNPFKILNAPEPWDPTWLKYTGDYKTDKAPGTTYFEYRKHGDYAGLIEMCNGQGTCRSLVNGTMCPSFRVTGNEKDTPRGRANILREALTGNLDELGFLSPAVYETLDLCLECKACKRECSSGLDVAKLKYEFLTHYNKKNGVPLRSRAFASINKINRLARFAPSITNWMYEKDFFKSALDSILKIDRRRTLPKLAPQSFQQWFKKHKKAVSSPSGSVILWDDCHLSDNHPELGIAAVFVLESLGFEVQLVPGRLCCGRPMISKGMLDKAKKNAATNISLLSPLAEQKIPIVGIEPSCVACFRDEYPELVPGEKADTVAGQVYFFEEFINKIVADRDIQIPFKNNLTPSKYLTHTHCYQKALDQHEQVLQFLRLIPNTTVEEIGSGCCGMAGSFGFEKEHYDISMKIGEENLFKEIRNTPGDFSIAAAGTSCRQQIKDGTGEIANHPVTILANALVNAESVLEAEN